MTGTQQEYSFIANDLVAYAHHMIANLPPFMQQFIPMDKIPAAAGAVSKKIIDDLDAFRAAHAQPLTPPVIAPTTVTTPLAAKGPKNGRRRK